LKNYFEKIEFQNINLHLPKTYANLIARKYLQKDLYQKKIKFPKSCLKSSNIIINDYSLILKGIILKALILFDPMQISPLAKIVTPQLLVNKIKYC
jgi:hypothetical protein